MAHVTGDAAASGAGGHVSGKDVVAVPVEVLAGPVIAGSCAGIGVPGGDLDIAQVNASIKHGRDEGVPSLRTRRVQKICVAILPGRAGG